MKRLVVAGELLDAAWPHAARASAELVAQQLRRLVHARQRGHLDGDAPRGRAVGRLVEQPAHGRAEIRAHVRFTAEDEPGAEVGDAPAVAELVGEGPDDHGRYAGGERHPGRARAGVADDGRRVRHHQCLRDAALDAHVRRRAAEVIRLDLGADA